MHERKRTMKVQIKSEIHVEGKTFEEAIEELRKRLSHLHAASLDDSLTDDYHHWNAENEGDVDWIPFSEITPNSRSLIHVVNTDDWSRL